MNCMFLGHRDVPQELEIELENNILLFIQNHRIDRFYVGNSGGFDYLVQKVLHRMNLNYMIVLYTLNEYVDPIYRDHTMYPEGIEIGLPRFAISRRNDWMIKNSDFAIVYMKYQSSNCFKWVEKANKKGVQIINLAEEI